MQADLGLWCSYMTQCPFSHVEAVSYHILYFNVISVKCKLFIFVRFVINFVICIKMMLE